MAISRNEHLKRKREAERLRKKKIQQSPRKLAEQNRKRRENYAKTKENRSRKKEKMSDRAIREVRRKWRLSKRNYRAKKKEAEDQSNAITEHHQVGSGRKRRARNKSKYHYVKQKLVLEIIQLKRDVAKFKKRWQRECHRHTPISDSPQSKCAREFKDDQVSPKIRKRLVFAAALENDLKSSYRSLKTNTEKRTFTSTLSLKFSTKYRFVSTCKPFFPYNMKKINIRAEFGVRKRKYHEVRQCVIKFFEREDVSVQAPGKKDVITRCKVQKQKRYLCNSIRYLHRKFCEENDYVVSYALFCRLRPFWVIDRKLSERDTCLCITHENMKLLSDRLMKDEKILKNVYLDTLIEEQMCCQVVKEECLFRTCEKCYDKIIECSEFNGNDESFYDLWQKKMEIGRDKKRYKRTVKERVPCKLHELVDRFFQLLPAYMAHLARIRHQYIAVRELKKNLDDQDYLLHIDFSENYTTKYLREIQAVHFGGNRMQITLHTGVIYNGQKAPQSFCTTSLNLKHDPVAIIAHLEPIFEKYISPNALNLHFLSDSPSSQYRNSAMFFLLKQKIIPRFSKLQNATWEYSESSHGKGAPDGVGGTIKRTCDKVVARGIHDISTFEDFTNIVQNHVSIPVIPIPNERDNELYERIKKLATVKGEGSSDIELFFLLTLNELFMLFIL